MHNVVIVDGARTAFGRMGGTIRQFCMSELASFAIKGLLEKTGIQERALVDSVMIGAALGDAKSVNIARYAALCAGLIMAVAAPVFPMIYDTTEAVRELASYMIWVTAAAIPFFAFSYCTYFVIRTGGRVFLTFILDSGVSY